MRISNNVMFRESGKIEKDVERLATVFKEYFDGITDSLNLSKRSNLDNSTRNTVDKIMHIEK